MGKGERHPTPEVHRQLSLPAVKNFAVQQKQGSTRPLSEARSCYLNLLCLARNLEGREIKETMETLSNCARLSKLCKMNFRGWQQWPPATWGFPHPFQVLSAAGGSRRDLRFCGQGGEQPRLEPKASPWCCLQGVNADDL